MIVVILSELITEKGKHSIFGYLWQKIINQPAECYVLTITHKVNGTLQTKTNRLGIKRL